MKIRLKAMLIITLTALGLIVFLGSTAGIIMLNAAEASEKEDAKEFVERFGAAYSREIEELKGDVSDWAPWDDTYRFIENNNTGYIESNIVNITFINLRLNMMLFVNISDQLVFGQIYDSVNGMTPVPQSLRANLSAIDALIDHNDTESMIAGILLLHEVPMLVASHPILTSMHEGPIKGTLIFGRSIDNAELAIFSQTSALSVTMCPVNDPTMPSDFQLAYSSFSKDTPIFKNPLNATWISGYALFDDINGAPAIVFRIDGFSGSYLEARTSFFYFLLALMTPGVVFSIVIGFLLNKFVLTRLSYLSDNVVRLGQNNKPFERILLKGNDEISILADRINKMFETIQNTQTQLRDYAEQLEEKVEERTKNVRESREKIRSILGTSPDAITAADLNGIIIECNEKACKLHNYSQDELIGKNGFQLIANKDRQRAMESIKIVLEQGLIENVEYTLVRKDGSEFPAELSASAIRSATGDPIGFVAIVRDITDHKIMERRLFNSERLAAIGELAAMIGHDLRNPLTGIVGATYYLKTKYGSKMDAKGKEMLKIIEGDIEHSNKIINDLLEYSGEIKLQLSDTNPKEMLAKALLLIKLPRNIQIINKTQNKPRMKADIEKMRRVFINIIKNAIDAMPKGGTLTIWSAEVKEGVSFSFADTGEGMSKKVLNKLWTPLFTTKAKGMGFGLPISKRIVEAHGGKIFVESIPKKGSTFTIVIPIEPEKRNEPSELLLESSEGFILGNINEEMKY